MLFRFKVSCALKGEGCPECSKIGFYPDLQRYLEIGYRGSRGVRMGFIGDLFSGTSSECMGSVGIVGVIPWSSEDEGRSEKGL